MTAVDPAVLVCDWCREPVLPWEPLAPTQGSVMHEECGMRAMVGGINHQRRTCHCFGGSEEPDPPGMTVRKAARAACSYFRTFGGGDEQPPQELQ